MWITPWLLPWCLVGLAKVSNGFDRIRAGTKVSCGGTLLVGKDVQPLQSVKPIRIVVSTVLDESQCGHKTSVWDLGCFLV
jgi:hypothetical protein